MGLCSLVKKAVGTLQSSASKIRDLSIDARMSYLDVKCAYELRKEIKRKQKKEEEIERRKEKEILKYWKKLDKENQDYRYPIYRGPQMFVNDEDKNEWKKHTFGVSTQNVAKALYQDPSREKDIERQRDYFADGLCSWDIEQLEKRLSLEGQETTPKEYVIANKGRYKGDTLIKKAA